MRKTVAALALAATSLLAHAAAPSPSAATGLAPALAAADAVGLLAQWCIATDARAAAAQQKVLAFQPPPAAVVTRPSSGGLSIRLTLGASASVELDMASTTGQVRSCTLDVGLTDPEATFELLQRRYFLGGNIDEYEPGHNTWVDLTSPAKVSLSAIFTFQISHAVTGQRVGRMTAVVMPSGS